MLLQCFSWKRPLWFIFFFIFVMEVAFAEIACSSALNCSLNGLCTSGICVCDPPWSGSACEKMNFKPVTFPQGYGMQPNCTTWGGGVIFDGKNYHIYVSRMTNACPLSYWGKNSRIDHAVSNSITGPYEFKDPAVNTWAHNAAPITLHDGSYAIVHIGDGSGPPDGGHNCTPPDRHDNLEPWHYNVDLHVPTAGSTIHVSKTLSGPWKPLSPNTLGGCNNPAPWVHTNGTIYILCGGTMKRAENISGPWTNVASVHHSGGPSGNYEDPYLYMDKRGHFHCIYHVYNTHEDKNQCVNSTVSAHIFSMDGYKWYTSKIQPYTTQIALSTGKTITVSTRERPKLFFDKSGQMTHLFNGVCSAIACPPPLGPKTGCVDCKYKNWDYTLVTPLDI